MPQYDYRCNLCDETFVVTASMKDKRDNVACPVCSTKDISRVFGLGSLGLAGLPTRKDTK
jgi:putative FmdB family regulatory protein